MLHSNNAGLQSKPETLFQKVLSWPVYDILTCKRPSIEVKEIPKEFQTCKHYTEAFRSLMLDEIFHQIESAMVTMSKGIDVQYYGRKLDRDMPNKYNVSLCLPKGENLPRTGDVMLLSARNLESRDQILKDNSFCTILVVTLVGEECKYGKYSTVWMDVLLSKSPHEGSSDRLYQVTHLANLTTDDCSWQAMTDGFKDSSGVINLILNKSNNGPNGENKASSSEAAIVQFGLNQSQGNVVASCISAIEHSSSSVRLVWGPPGTGKTKTASVLLYFLLKMAKKPRVLVCAPTNTALGRLTRHLISLIEKSSEAEAESIQDIILLGNEERLKVKGDKDLSKVYVNYRVKKMSRWSMSRGRELTDREREEELLEQAKLVFCTPFISSKVRHQKFNILIIDEAAYVKECESMIPLAYTKIEHLLLIGDDKQLPSLVKSPSAKGGYYGRSLFERLSQNGHRKYLLKVQYRMHPCISKFPNENFYDNKIIDGPNVKEYHCAYIPGSIFGPYSFIHVEDGCEEHTGQGFRNLVEADVVANIVYRLAKECAEQEKKPNVGIISQYTAQVTALQERIGKYQKIPFLSVQINTIDSFQGEEKDIIILSTVRHNHGGNIGFLDCRKRTNVALTRAKNCLWILGHKDTLHKSNSVWRDLVQDAETRSCCFSARAHITTEEAIEAAAEEKTEVAVQEADEEATEADPDIIEGEGFINEPLKELPQLSQTVERVKVNYKGPYAKNIRNSLNKRSNFYEKDRTSTDGRFWSYEQEDLYTSVYKQKDFTDSKWINWERIKHSKDKELKELEEKCLQIGLHTLLSKKQDWHEETIRQFFSTFYVGPDGTLVWMTGMNRKITVTKKFCQKVLLDPSMYHNEQRNDKIKEQLDQTEDDMVNRTNGDLRNLILRLIDNAILPRGGDRNGIHKEAKIVMYYFLLGKPFDFVDLMFSHIKKTRSDTRRLMPYAPFIMLLINRATNEDFVRECEGFKEHKEFNIFELRPIQTKNGKVSKPKDRVPPLAKRQRVQQQQTKEGKVSKPKDRVPPLAKRQRVQQQY